MPKPRALLAGLLLLLLLASGAFAESFPARPITLVNPYPAGGPADVLARTVAARMQESLGNSVIVENRPGAGTAIGAQFVARAKPDGYTLLIGGSPSHVIAPALIKDAPYDGIADFSFIAMVGIVPNVLVVPAARPWHSVKQLVDAARSTELSVAHVGIGSIPQFLELLLQQRAKLKLIEVGYKGAAPAIIDLLAGMVDLGFLNIPPVLSAGADKLRVLAVANDTRARQLPQVPTMAEAGFPGIEMSTWYGISAPAKTPKAIIDKLYTAIAGAVTQPSTRQQLSLQGVEPFLKNPDAYLAYVKADAGRMLPLIKAAGMTAQ
jgi:tripartite-type tricarboxylate transporter receptor subunit TctC